MGSAIRRRFRTGIDFSSLTDDTRHTLAGGIKSASATSPLFLGSGAIQTSVVAVGKKSDDLKTANVAVATDKGKLAADLSTETDKRADFDNELHTLVTLTQNGALKPSDLTGMGLPYVPPAPRPKLGPESPTGVTPKFPVKGHGKAFAVAEYSGTGRPQFAAEMSLDGITYTALTGHGKQRTLTGASGTKIWVRFATVRGELQSAWCTPVIITLP